MSILDLFRKPLPPPDRQDVSVKTFEDGVEKKAFIQSTTTNMWQFFFGQSSNKYYSPKQLLAYNTGWVNVCNSKNAQTLSTIPVKMYYRKPASKEIKLVKHLPVSMKQARFLERTVGKVMGDVVEIVEHPLLKVLCRPNNRMSWPDFAGFIQSYLGMIGNSYVVIERDKEGNCIALWPLLSENVSVVINENDIGYGDVKVYKYSNSLSQQGQSREKVTDIKPEDMIHFVNFQPGNTLYGKGELEAAICCAEREFYYDQVENYLNRNNARPDFLVAYKNGMFFSPDYWCENFKPWVARMAEYAHKNSLPVIYHGCGNVHKIFQDYIEAGIDAYNPLEVKAGMDVNDLRREYGHRIGFCGGSDIQVWETGNKDKIRREVLRKLNAAKGGGYIFQSDHSVAGDVSGHTYDYIVKLVREYGKYPIKLGEFDEKVEGGK